MALIMSTAEIESALVNFESTYPNLCQRIALPQQTYENRQSHALRIANAYSPSRQAVLIIGGVHAREWGGPDIVVNFAGDLLRAYSQGKGLQYLGKSFSALDIKAIVETMTVVIFPCVNPDGVEFSHTGVAMWRKNRNPAASGGLANKIGVDINRNYDFLWNYKKYFDPLAWASSLASDDPASETFHGASAFSEPETLNVKWLLDQLPTLTFFLDLHSYTGDVLYNWGDDNNQSVDPGQNFGSPTYDGKRGVLGAGYAEYISAADVTTASEVALAVSDAMVAVRGRPYQAKQAVGLYATAGASDDYVFSRHLVQPNLAKAFGYTIEFNFGGDGPNPFLVTADPTVLDNTMLDVIPGLIQLCLSAQRRMGWPAVVVETDALNIVYVNPATGEIWYLGGDGKIHKTPPIPDPYRSAAASQIWRLLNAYEAVNAVQGKAGDIARQGLMKAIEEIAANATK